MPKVFAGGIRFYADQDLWDSEEVLGPLASPILSTGYSYGGFAVVPEYVGVAFTFDQQHIPSFHGLLKAVQAVENRALTLLVSHAGIWTFFRFFQAGSEAVKYDVTFAIRVGYEDGRFTCVGGLL